MHECAVDMMAGPADDCMLDIHELNSAGTPATIHFSSSEGWQAFINWLGLGEDALAQLKEISIHFERGTPYYQIMFLPISADGEVLPTTSVS